MVKVKSIEIKEVATLEWAESWTYPIKRIIFSPEDQGKSSTDDTLTAVLATEDELWGSYNWDNFLHWCL